MKGRGVILGILKKSHVQVMTLMIFYRIKFRIFMMEPME